MSAPAKPKLTGRLVAAELDSIADQVRRVASIGLTQRKSYEDVLAKIATRLERLADALK